MCMAHVSIVTEEYLGFWHWLWFSNCLQTSISINLKCCIKTYEYFILTNKENCQMDKLWKIWKETELCSFFIDLFAFKLDKLCLGVGIFVSFFDPGAGVLLWKAVPGVGILKKKISGLGGGVVTGQIDTSIIRLRKKASALFRLWSKNQHHTQR